MNKHLREYWLIYSVIGFFIMIIVNFYNIKYENYLNENSESITKQNIINNYTIKENKIKEENPILNSAIEEKISIQSQEDSKKVIIVEGKSTKVFSVSYNKDPFNLKKINKNKKKKQIGKFCLTIQNNSSFDYGGIGADKYVKIKIEKGMYNINEEDLRKDSLTYKLEEKIKKLGGISNEHCFSLDRLYKYDNGKYPSKINISLIYNNNISLNSGYEIILMKSNIALINTSGVEGLITKYYNKLKETKKGFYGIQRINNYNNNGDFLLKDKINKNTILYSQNRYLKLAENINRDLFENEFNIKKVSIEECQLFIIDNRIELLRDKNNKPIRYNFDGSILSSDYSICKEANLIFNIIN